LTGKVGGVEGSAWQTTVCLGGSGFPLQEKRPGNLGGGSKQNQRTRDKGLTVDLEKGRMRRGVKGGNSVVCRSAEKVREKDRKKVESTGGKVESRGFIHRKKKKRPEKKSVALMKKISNP